MTNLHSCLLLRQATRNGADIWLSIWLRHSQRRQGRALLATMSDVRTVFTASVWQSSKVSMRGRPLLKVSHA